MLIDSHAHLNFSDYSSDLQSVINRAQENGIGKVINIGTSISDSRGTIKLAEKYGSLFATVGNHPNDLPSKSVDSADWDEFESLLVETDCPFLSPEPFRGKRNEPAHIRFTAQKLAEIKGLSFEEIVKITRENTDKLYGIG